MLIKIKYLGPTNFKGSRLKAYCNQGSVTCSYDYGVSDDQRALDIALVLFEKIKKLNGNHGKVTKKEIVGYIDNMTYVKLRIKY